MNSEENVIAALPNRPNVARIEKDTYGGQLGDWVVERKIYINSDDDLEFTSLKEGIVLWGKWQVVRH